MSSGRSQYLVELLGLGRGRFRQGAGHGVGTGICRERGEQIGRRDNNKKNGRGRAIFPSFDDMGLLRRDSVPGTSKEDYCALKQNDQEEVVEKGSEAVNKSGDEQSEHQSRSNNISLRITNTRYSLIEYFDGSAILRLNCGKCFTQAAEMVVNPCVNVDGANNRYKNIKAAPEKPEKICIGEGTSKVENYAKQMK